MKVTVRTFGGFAPALRPAAREVDGATLAPLSAETLEKLVQRLPRHAQPASPRPDERHYEMTIDAHGDSRVLRCSDTGMTDELAALLAFVERHGHHC